MLSMVAFWGVMSTEIDTLEYLQTENIETEVRDVDRNRIRITKVYACCHEHGDRYSQTEKIETLDT